MKLRLNTKYIRTRVSIWVSLSSVIFSLILAVKFIFEDNLRAVIYSLVIFLIFGIVAIAGILTYKEKFSRLDKKRWNKPGIKSKLEVIVDWIIE